MANSNAKWLAWSGSIVLGLVIAMIGITRIQAQGDPNAVLALPYIPSVDQMQAIILNLDTREETRIPIDYREPIAAAFSPTAEYIGVTWRDAGGNPGLYILDTQHGTIHEPGQPDIPSGYHAYGLEWLTPTQFSYVIYDYVFKYSQFCHTSVDNTTSAGDCVPNTMPGYVGRFYAVDDTRFLFSLENRDLLNFEVPVVEPHIYLAQRVGDRDLAILADFPGESPALSADHEQVAYCVANEVGFRDVFVSRIDGSTAFNLTQTPEADECSPAWSFEDIYLSFERGDSLTSGRGPRRVCVYTESAGTECVSDWIATGGWAFYDGVWSSHDAQLILHATERTGHGTSYHIYRVDITTRAFQEIIFDGDPPVIYDWMPVIETAEP